MLSILWTAIIGAVTGTLAWLMLRRQVPNVFGAMIAGIAGSIVATWLGRLVGWYSEGQSAGFLA